MILFIVYCLHWTKKRYADVTKKPRGVLAALFVGFFWGSGQIKNVAGREGDVRNRIPHKPLIPKIALILKVSPFATLKDPVNVRVYLVTKNSPKNGTYVFPSFAVRVVGSAV